MCSASLSSFLPMLTPRDMDGCLTPRKALVELELCALTVETAASRMIRLLKALRLAICLLSLTSNTSIDWPGSRTSVSSWMNIGTFFFVPLVP